MLVIILYTLLYIEKEQKQTEREGQRLDGLPSCPPRPRPRPLLQVVREGKSKAADETERERTRAKDAADIFASSSPLFLFCLLSPPSTPSPALTLSPTSRNQSTSNRAGPRPSVILPASSSSPLPDGEGRAASQPGRGDPLPFILPALSTLPGCRPHSS